MSMFRTTSVIVVALLAGANAAHAVTAPGRDSDHARLQVASGRAPRAQATVAWNRMPKAMAALTWERFARASGGSWQALWDTDTGVPSRIFGPGIAMPGSVASPARAEAYARAFLAEHIDLLAPGSDPEDFVVVSNHFDGAIRTIGMYQHHQGMRVLQGQVNFRFKNDRLFVIGSEALPHVRVPALSLSPSVQHAVASAEAWIAADAKQTQTLDVDGPHVLPIVFRGGVDYRLVMRVTVAAQAPVGRWQVYVDALDGAPVAREQTLRFAEGTVLYDIAERYPGAARSPVPVPRATLMVDGAEVVSDGQGVVSWPDTGSASLVTAVAGPLVRVDNYEQDEASASFTLEPGDTVVWDAKDDELVDAQINAFIHASIGKSYVRRFAPRLAFLDKQLEVRVNLDSTCNAFSDGQTINFFVSSEECENTARLADVVYHELGHAVHVQSLIRGVGAFEGAFSEGLADYLAATITDDPAMARGFFRDDEPLRHVDPEDYEYRWPDDISEIHYTGLIFASAMWDLRKALIELHGQEEGVALADRLYYAAVQRASIIPTTYVEILAADDDDGDLSNGTPHECIINEVFGGLHGLRDVGGEHTPLGVQAPERDGYDVSTRILGLTDRCVGDQIAAVSLRWGLKDGSAKPGTGEDSMDDEDGEMSIEDILPTTVAMRQGEDGRYEGTIPRQPEGSVVRYQVEVMLADGGTWYFPDNLADPAYEFYVGELLPLYCTDFETDPYAAGWSHGLTFGDVENGADDWQWGTPAGSSGKEDPVAAFSGSHAIGNDLGGAGYDGKYQAEKANYTLSPVVDIGSYSDVRIQYRRWLTVEDAYWDHANIHVNGKQVWRNLATPTGKIHHIDTEWVLHDLPVSRHVRGNELQVGFEIQSDSGLEFGGWTIDDFCVVARPDSICGDGVISGAEECDDGPGNDDLMPDACRANCRLSVCGDQVIDQGEQCDDGNDIDTDDCTTLCMRPGGEDGGCSTQGSPGSPLVLTALLLWLMRRRRCQV